MLIKIGNAPVRPSGSSLPVEPARQRNTIAMWTWMRFLPGRSSDHPELRGMPVAVNFS
jgi:hypothetical protein